jgi:gamma-glutamylputrescine oxidase
MKESVYWQRAATPRGRPLRGEASSEVVVVGGGMAGLTCAQALLERGVEVALVERASCGAGASGASSGFVTPDSELELSDLVANYGVERGRALWEFARSGLERIRATIQRHGFACDYQVQDSLLVAASARAYRRVVVAEHRMHERLGYRPKLYERDSLAGVLGSRAFHGGIRYDGTFGIDSYAYCRALRDELERRGARVYEGAPALRLDGRGVETPEGRLKADKVAVLTDRDLPTLGLAAGEVHPVQAFLMLSRPLTAGEIETVFPSGDRLMVWDTDLIYQYFRVTGEGRLLLGAARLLDMYAPGRAGAGRSVVHKLRRYLAMHFPALPSEFEYLWSGLVGVSKDFAPVLGRHPTLPGVWYAGAAAGLPWSAALGSYLAEKMCDGRDELDQTLSSERRFTVGRRAQRLLGKPLAFLLSHAIAKYQRK